MRPFLAMMIIGLATTQLPATVSAAEVAQCDRADFEKCPDDGGRPPDDGGGGGVETCPVQVGDGSWKGCWHIDTNNITACAEMEIGIARRWFDRHPDDPDYWRTIRTDTHCVTPGDGGVDPWEMWAGVNVSSGDLGSELAGTEEVPIWTGYENGFWLEGDVEVTDSEATTEPRTGLEIFVEVRAWPSEVSIDTGDDGPLSGDNETSSFMLETDEFGEVVTGSEEDPLFTHMFETKGTDAGHECACFLAEVDAVWSGEYRWGMGGLTTGWHDFDHQVEAEPTLVALQVWEVVSRLR